MKVLSIKKSPLRPLDNKVDDSDGELGKEESESEAKEFAIVAIPKKKANRFFITERKIQRAGKIL